MSTDKEDVILAELTALRAEVRDIRATQMEHVVDITKLKVRTGLWSAVVSAVVALAAVVVKSWTT